MKHATLNTHGCCDGTGQEHHNACDDPEYTGPLTYVKACTDRACLARREAAWDAECETGRASRGAGAMVPWDFSKPPKDAELGTPNLPTPEGRLLGEQLARLTDIEEERLRERFPKMHRRCGDCALRLGTVPNGCPETLMDVVKAVVERVPFYCHKAITEDGQPRILCAGYAALVNSDALSPSCSPLVSPSSRSTPPTGTPQPAARTSIPPVRVRVAGLSLKTNAPAVCVGRGVNTHEGEAS